MWRFDYEHNYIKVAQLRPPVTKMVIQWFPTAGAAAFSQGSRELLPFFTILSFLFIILFQFADVDIPQSMLDIWFHMLIFIAIMCCVYDSFGTKLHATK